MPSSSEEPRTEPIQQWWGKRTPIERIMFGVSGLCLLLCVCLVIALICIGCKYQSTSLENQEELASIESQKLAGICLDPGCVKAASVILNNIDETVSPCENFHKFACGGWLDKHPIPEDRTDVSAFSVVQEEVNLLLRKIVESPRKGNDPQYILNLKNMYNSCMNTTHIEMLGSDPIDDVIGDLGNWPVVEGRNWNPRNFDWMDIPLTLRRTGFKHDIFFNVYVGPDDRNNTRHIIKLDQASLGMPDKKYLLKGLEDPIVAAYYKLMVNSAVMLGANKGTAEREMKEVVKFEIRIANISIPREERRNTSLLYNKMNLTELFDLAPEVNWDRYMNNLLVDEIRRSEEIIVAVPKYIQRMAKLLSETDEKTVANYLIWRVVQQTFLRLSKPWRDIWQNYNVILTGKVRQESRWQFCLETIFYDRVRTSLASLYIRKYFQESSKELALELVNYLRREFLNIVSTIDWMDDQTRERAKEKANKMEAYIGYPDELLDDSKLVDLYEKLNLHSMSYFENSQISKKWETDVAFSKLRKPYIKGDWLKRSSAYIVGAYYSKGENCIKLPAGILQGVFFSKDRPNYLNFGAIGSIIGHEITHGFDDSGRQFDKDGNNVNWWEPETDSTYKKKAQCIIDQYSAYNATEVGMQLNGFNNQGENIADNGGIKEAFQAYEQWVKDHGAEGSLPGLKYTPRQLFWIGAAHVWCANYRPEFMKQIILTNSHSPDRFRIIGPVSNAPAFAKEFDCPLGSPMNPVKKCSVW